MWRRLAVVVVGLFLVASGTASGGSRARSQFAAAEIEAVVAAGLMAPSVAAFRPDDPLTSSELAVVVSSLGGPISVDDPDAPVSVRELDARLVTLAGLRPAAQAVRVAAVDGGLSRAAVARNGDGRALARLPRESSPRGRRARARGHRSDHQSRGGVQHRQVSRPHRCPGRVRARAGGELRASAADRVATRRSRPRSSLRGLAVRLGRHVREASAALRKGASGRLRLLRVRLARLQDEAVRRSAWALACPRRPDDVRDERRGSRRRSV